MRHGPKAARRGQDPGISPELILLSSSQVILAGAVGFEPTVHGTKNRCLTTWPRPNCGGVSTQAHGWVQGLNPTFFAASSIRIAALAAGPEIRRADPPETRLRPPPRCGPARSGFRAPLRHFTCSIRQFRATGFDIASPPWHQKNRRSFADPTRGWIFHLCRPRLPLRPAARQVVTSTIMQGESP